jgi:hypothetical protein
MSKDEATMLAGMRVKDLSGGWEMSAVVGTRVGVETGKPSRPLARSTGWQGALKQ